MSGPRVLRPGRRAARRKVRTPARAQHQSASRATCSCISTMTQRCARHSMLSRSQKRWGKNSGCAEPRRRRTLWPRTGQAMGRTRRDMLGVAAMGAAAATAARAAKPGEGAKQHDHHQCAGRIGEPEHRADPTPKRQSARAGSDRPGSANDPRRACVRPDGRQYYAWLCRRTRRAFRGNHPHDRDVGRDPARASARSAEGLHRERYRARQSREQDRRDLRLPERRDDGK